MIPLDACMPIVAGLSLCFLSGALAMAALVMFLGRHQALREMRMLTNRQRK